MNKLTIILLSNIYFSTVFSANGFLTKEELPNNYRILPAPPITPTLNKKNMIITPAFAQDTAISEKMYYTQNNSQQKFFNGQTISKNRLEIAKADVNKSTEYFLRIFIDPLNIAQEDKLKIKRETYNIVTKVVLDANNSAKKAKQKFHRVRPYYFYSRPSCTGDDPQSEKRELSYPSGHSARGMTVARVLAKILPNEYRQKLLARGMEYGDSRVICGAHWQSDVEASRVLSGFVMNSLEENSDYENAIEQAKGKIGKIHPLQKH